MQSYLKICILLYGISISADNKFFNSGVFSRYIPNHKIKREREAEKAQPTIPVRSEDILFSMPLASKKPIIQDPMSSEDQLFRHSITTPIDPQNLSRENDLFYNPLTKNSKVHIPFTQKVKNLYNETKYTIQHEPSTALVGGTAGGAVGYGIGTLWNKAYKKGLNLLEQKPAFVKEHPKIINGLQKVVNSPFLQRAYVIKAIGKFCIIGIGYAASHSKQLETIKKRVF